MTPQIFLDSLAFVYLTDEEFQPRAEVAGVDWYRLPGDLFSVKTVRKYLDAKKSSHHKAALRDVQGDLRFLEMGELNLRLISNDEEVLGHDCRKQTEALLATKLAEQIIAEPYRARHLIESFSSESSDGIKAAPVGPLMGVEIREHLERVKAGVSLVEIPGFERLSQMIGGFNAERISILTGGTGFGKTNLALNFGIRMALKHKVGYINMEMSYADMMKRIYCITTETTFADYEAGKISESQITTTSDLLGDKLIMTSGRSLSLVMIEAWARSLAKDGLKLLIVDYDQKIELPYSRNEQEWMAMKKAMEKLEELAKELKFHVMVLAQVNRDGGISSSHRATYAAHTVLSFEDNPNHGPVIWAKKNRHGKREAAMRVKYQPECGLIHELDEVTVTAPKSPEFKFRGSQ